MNSSFLSSYKRISIFYFLIVLANIVFLGSYLNLLVTFFEYFIVIKFIGDKRINEAIFLHFSFIMTSIAPTTLLSVQEDISIPLMSYARIKVGPICFHYIVSFILLLLTMKKKTTMPKNTLFYKLYKAFLFLAISGVILGLFGFIFRQYYEFSSVLLYGTYIFMVIINMFLLIKNYTPELLRLFHSALPPIIGATILATAFSYFALGIAGSYASLNMVLQPDLMYFGIIFLMGYYESPYRKYVLIVSLLYIYMKLLGATGHDIIIIAIGLLYFLYYTYFSDEYMKAYPKTMRKSRHVFTILLPVIVVGAVAFVSFGDLFLIKLNNVFSLFSSSVDEVDTSPYVRIATTMNVWDNNKYNPIGLLFGQGYGGYFTDSLHMFDGLGDLTDGGWPEKDVQTGRFTRGHDTTATVPLLHGFGGLAILFYYIYKYAMFTKKSYFAYAIFPWVLFTFYFNIQYAVIGISFLFAAEFKGGVLENNKLKDDKSLLFYK